MRLLEAQEYESFMRLAVLARKNILVSGPTGSGKTTWTKALIREIPREERLITIEDAQELVLDHPNHVRLFYSKDDQGLSRVTPKQLLESCLRMKPDRILLAEIRSEEAFDYLRNVNSGHPGSITSVHAASAELAFEQLVLLVKQSRAGQELPRADIKELLYLLVDVVIQFGVERHQRFIKEIWYEPHRKRRRLGAAELRRAGRRSPGGRSSSPASVSLPLSIWRAFCSSPGAGGMCEPRAPSPSRGTPIITAAFPACALVCGCPQRAASRSWP